MLDNFPYSCIVYDLDGTLIDSRKDIAAALNAGRNHFNLKSLHLENILPMIGHGLPNLVEKGFLNEDITVQNALPIVQQFYQDNPTTHTTVYPHVIETLTHFKSAGIQQYILSNKPSFLVPLVLDALNLSCYFKHSYGGEDFPKRKPDPIALRHIISSETSLNSSEFLMVGDMSPDIDMAKNAGIDSAFCQYGYSPTQLDATHQIQHFSDLTKITPLC